MKIITRKAIRKGLEQGVIILESPDNEVICRIGDYFFFFAGSEGEGVTAEEYRENVPESEIIDEIYSAITSFREHGHDEYAYYAAYIEENLTVSPLELTEEETSTFKDYFSRYCRCRIAEGKCDEDGCELCPVNSAYDQIFKEG